MEVLIRILQLILSLSILVVFHEFGHFIAAKIFKTRVEKFYLFFNPWFSIFKFKFKGTEYGMGWLPLGGYVKISGMIDESMDKEQLEKEPEPWEFRSKPAWQRLIIMLGGVTVNVILAMAIFIGMLFSWGVEYVPTAEVNRYGILTDSLGKSIGFRNGDKILKVGDEFVDNFSRIPAEILLNQPDYVTVERNGQEVKVFVGDTILATLVKAQDPNLFLSGMPFLVDSVQKDSNAEKSGLLKGDEIVGVNGDYNNTFYGIARKILAHPGKEVQLDVIRGVDTLQLNATVAKDGRIGALPYIKTNTIKYSFLQAIPAGIEMGYNEIGDYLKQLKLITNPKAKAYDQVGGFITIGKIFPSHWSWYSFWRITALLSIMLAVVNVLPIPALDGGHTLFLLYEIIARRKPSDRFLEVAQVVGMVILFSLLIYANGNDIVKLFN